MAIKEYKLNKSTKNVHIREYYFSGNNHWPETVMVGFQFDNYTYSVTVNYIDADGASKSTTEYSTPFNIWMQVGSTCTWSSAIKSDVSSHFNSGITGSFTVSDSQSGITVTQTNFKTYRISFKNATYGTWTNGTPETGGKYLLAQYGDVVTKDGNKVTCKKWQDNTTRWTNTLSSLPDTDQWDYTVVAAGPNVSTNPVTQAAYFYASTDTVAEKEYGILLNKYWDPASVATDGANWQKNGTTTSGFNVPYSTRYTIAQNGQTVTLSHSSFGSDITLALSYQKSYHVRSYGITKQTGGTTLDGYNVVGKGLTLLATLTDRLAVYTLTVGTANGWSNTGNSWLNSGNSTITTANYDDSVKVKYKPDEWYCMYDGSTRYYRESSLWYYVPDTGTMTVNTTNFTFSQPFADGTATLKTDSDSGGTAAGKSIVKVNYYITSNTTHASSIIWWKSLSAGDVIMSTNPVQLGSTAYYQITPDVGYGPKVSGPAAGTLLTVNGTNFTIVENGDPGIIRHDFSARTANTYTLVGLSGTTVTWYKDSSNTITSQLYNGALYKVTITPDFGKHFTVSGTEYRSVNTYTYTIGEGGKLTTSGFNLSSDYTNGNATWKSYPTVTDLSYELNTYAGNGQIVWKNQSGTTITSAVLGTNLSYTVTPNAHYNAPTGNSTVLNTTNFNFDEIDQTANATYKTTVNCTPKQFKISGGLASSPNATIKWYTDSAHTSECTSSTYVNYGATVYYVVTPSIGYGPVQSGSKIVNDTNFTVTDGSGTGTGSNSGTAVSKMTLSCSPNLYAINHSLSNADYTWYDSNGNPLNSGSTQLSIAYGSTVYCVINPNSHYEVYVGGNRYYNGNTGKYISASMTLNTTNFTLSSNYTDGNATWKTTPTSQAITYTYQVSSSNSTYCYYGATAPSSGNTTAVTSTYADRASKTVYFKINPQTYYEIDLGSGTRYYNTSPYSSSVGGSSFTFTDSTSKATWSKNCTEIVYTCYPAIVQDPNSKPTANATSGYVSWSPTSQTKAYLSGTGATWTITANTGYTRLSTYSKTITAFSYNDGNKSATANSSGNNPSNYLPTPNSYTLTIHNSSYPITGINSKAASATSRPDIAQTVYYNRAYSFEVSQTGYASTTVSGNWTTAGNGETTATALVPIQYSLTWSGNNWSGGWYANANYSSAVTWRYYGYAAYFRATPNLYYEKTISGTNYRNGTYYTTSVATSLTADWAVNLGNATPIAYSLTITVNDTKEAISSYGVSRTSSPIGGGASGAIYNNGTIYGNDTLTATVTAKSTWYGSWDHDGIGYDPVVSALSDEYARIKIENPNTWALICEYSTNSNFSGASTVTVPGKSGSTNGSANTGTLSHNTKYYFRFKYQQKRDVYTYSVSKSWASLTVDGNESITFSGDRTDTVETGSWLYGPSSVNCTAILRPLITVKGDGHQSSIKVGSTTVSSGWSGNVDYNTTITWTAATDYAYQVNGSASSTITASATSNTEYKKDVYYGYYTISASNCARYSGDAAGWYALGTTPSTVFKASAGWSFGGSSTEDTSDSLSPASSVPSKIYPSPGYCNITVGAKYSTTLIASQTVLKQVGSTVASSTYYNTDPWDVNFDHSGQPAYKWRYSGKTANSVTVANTSTTVYTVYSTQTERSFNVNFNGSNGAWMNGENRITTITAPYSTSISKSGLTVTVGSDSATWIPAGKTGHTATGSVSGSSSIVGSGVTFTGSTSYTVKSYRLSTTHGTLNIDWFYDDNYFNPIGPTDQVNYGTAVYYNCSPKTGYTGGSTSSVNDGWTNGIPVTSSNFNFDESLSVASCTQLTNATRISGTISLGALPTGVASLKCYRKYWNNTGYNEITSYPANINYGDTFYWTATASTGYNNPSVSYGSSSNVYTWQGSQGGSITSVSASGLSAGNAKTYSITLNKNGGTTAGSCTATYNSSSLTSWSAATRTGYSCNGYYTATSGGTKVINANGTLVASVSGYTNSSSQWIKDSTVTLYAQWTINKYTVTFAATNGSWSPTSITNVNYGTTWSTSGDVVTLSDNFGSSIYTPRATTVDYTSGSYTITDSSGTVTSNTTITGVTSTTARKYTIKWYNGSTLLETDSNVSYNATLTYNGATPTKASTVSKNYSFSKWRLWSESGTEVVSGTTTNPGSTSTTTLNIYATFTETDRLYTIKWQNSSTTLETDSNVKYGNTLTYNSATPTKTQTDQYTYSFNEWRLGSESGSTVTSGTTTCAGSTSSTTIYIYATFTPYERSYDVTLSNGTYSAWSNRSTITAAYSTSITKTSALVNVGGTKRPYSGSRDYYSLTITPKYKGADIGTGVTVGTGGALTLSESTSPYTYTIQAYSRTGGTVYWGTSNSVYSSGGSTTLATTYGNTVYWRIDASDGYNRPSTYYGSMTLNNTNFTISSTTGNGNATYKGSAIGNCTAKTYSVTKNATRATITANSTGTFNSALSIGIAFNGTGNSNGYNFSGNVKNGTTELLALSTGSNSYTMSGTYYSAVTINATYSPKSYTMYYSPVLTPTGLSWGRSGTDTISYGSQMNIGFVISSGYTFPVSIPLGYVNESTQSFVINQTITLNQSDCYENSEGGNDWAANITYTGSYNSIIQIGQVAATYIQPTTYTVSMSAGTGVNSVYSSTSSNATSGNSSGHAYNTGTTVYIFAKMAQNKRPNESGAVCISSDTRSNNSIWRITSKNVTSDWNYGQVNSTTSATIPVFVDIYYNGNSYDYGWAEDWSTTLGSKYVYPEDLCANPAKDLNVPGGTLSGSWIGTTRRPSSSAWSGTVYASGSQTITPSPMYLKFDYTSGGGGGDGD